MKKWIHSSNELEKRTITITMIVEEESEDIAASDYLNHPKSIKKSKRITDKHLQYLNDIIATFDHNIQAAGFPIVDRHPGSNSYSYYIEFIPITESGEELLPIDLIFRVSDHFSRSAEGSKNSSFARIIGFTLENEDFDKASELIYEGVRILRELKKGNIDILDQL